MLKHGQIHSRDYLKDRRARLRNDCTTAEAVLWTMIRSRKLLGRKFRRQHSIENFIVDFYCPSEKLVIEVDGSIHDNLGQANADQLRDERLKFLGFKVLRIRNEVVLHHPGTALELIISCFGEGDHPFDSPP